MLGSGFVSFEDEAAARAVIQQLQGTECRDLCPQYGRLSLRLAEKSRVQTEFEARMIAARRLETLVPSPHTPFYLSLRVLSADPHGLLSVDSKPPFPHPAARTGEGGVHYSTRWRLRRSRKRLSALPRGIGVVW